jgi:hypothetical protein
MPHRQAVQCATVIPPTRQVAIHVALKALVVGRFKEVNHFVDNYVFKALAGFFAQLRVQTNRASRGRNFPIQSSSFEQKIRTLGRREPLPFQNQKSNGGFQLASQPLLIEFLAFFLGCFRADVQNDFFGC